MTVKEIFTLINGPFDIVNTNNQTILSGYQRKGYLNSSLCGNQQLENAEVIQLYGGRSGWLTIVCNYR